MKINDAKRFPDDRGFFQELGRGEFYQVNWSFSKRLTLRGLHLAQYPKLVTCITGEIWDVAVDCRPSSPEFGFIHTTTLSREGVRQALIPAGFAHGFFAVEDSDVVYAMGGLWKPDDEITIKWDDKDLRVPWPPRDYIISERDQNGLSWEDFKRLAKDLALE